MAKTAKKKQLQKSDANLVPRPPVVTLMGHVDHGKTSILDYIRQTHFQKAEAGGITQSIGAYQIDIAAQLKTPQDFKQTRITFIDTPGHEAFAKMRARGGQAADLVVLVIARNSGVQPQTIEAINHAQAAQAPLLVVINKMDLPGQSVTRIKKDLSQHGVLVEGLGGEVLCLEVSAKTGEGMAELLEMILLAAQLQELKADPAQPGSGVIIESWRDPKQGVRASLILKNGRLKVGDVIVAKSGWARLKRLSDWRGKTIRRLEPGMPAEVLGFKSLPEAGEEFYQLASERAAQEKTALAKERLAAVAQVQEEKDGDRESSARNLILGLVEPEDLQILNLIIKADARGSLDALHHAIEKLGSEKVNINFVHEGIGQISESDILLAASTGAIVLGFRVKVDSAAVQAARAEKVVYRVYEIIYHLLEELKDVLRGKVDRSEIRILARAEVLKVFELSNKTKIAGSRVLEGNLRKGQKARVIRSEEVLGQARVDSLRQGKKKAGSVKEGQECGIGLKPEVEFEKGDLIETYED